MAERIAATLTRGSIQCSQNWNRYVVTASRPARPRTRRAAATGCRPSAGRAASRASNRERPASTSQRRYSSGASNSTSTGVALEQPVRLVGALVGVAQQADLVGDRVRRGVHERPLRLALPDQRDGRARRAIAGSSAISRAARSRPQLQPKWRQNRSSAGPSAHAVDSGHGPTKARIDEVERRRLVAGLHGQRSSTAYGVDPRPSGPATGGRRPRSRGSPAAAGRVTWSWRSFLRPGTIRAGGTIGLPGTGTSASAPHPDRAFPGSPGSADIRPATGQPGSARRRQLPSTPVSRVPDHGRPARHKEAPDPHSDPVLWHPTTPATRADPERNDMADKDKYSFLVIKYPWPDTADDALRALKELSDDKVVKLRDAVAIRKTEKGKIKLHQTKDDTIGKGFVKGGVIGVLFAMLFGPVGWIAHGRRGRRAVRELRPWHQAEAAQGAGREHDRVGERRRDPRRVGRLAGRRRAHEGPRLPGHARHLRHRRVRTRPRSTRCSPTRRRSRTPPRCSRSSRSPPWSSRLPTSSPSETERRRRRAAGVPRPAATRSPRSRASAPRTRRSWPPRASRPPTTCSPARAARPAGTGTRPRDRASARTLILGWVNRADLMRIPGVGVAVQRPARGRRRRLAGRAGAPQRRRTWRRRSPRSSRPSPGIVRRVPGEAEIAELDRGGGIHRQGRRRTDPSANRKRGAPVSGAPRSSCPGPPA